MIEPAEMQWLIEHRARHLAMEIYGPRSDCARWRTQLIRSMDTGSRTLAPSHGQPTALQDSPTYGARRLDLTLRAARVAPYLEAHRIGLHLMTDADVLVLSQGEVVSEAVLNLRGRPVPGGLFCQRIFGPDRVGECACGGRHRTWDVGECSACGHTLVEPRERGRRFGHIELPAPVVHPWYLKGAAGARLARSLRLTERELRQVADCELVLITDPGPTPLLAGQLLSIQEWQGIAGRAQARAVAGGDAVKVLLHRAGEAVPAGLSPDAVVMQRLPVLPPHLRPHDRLEDGRIVESDLNRLYGAVISQAAVLRKDNGWPISVRMEAHRLLQRNVDNLLDNARQIEPTRGRDGRTLVSLAGWLTARQDSTGPLRHDFLRRSVDYTARARLVVGQLPDPTGNDVTTAPDHVLLGRDLALPLVEPLLVQALIAGGAATDATAARSLISERSESVMRLLESVCEQTLVLVAFPYGPWRLVALRLHAAEVPALQVQSGLLDLVGWENLGEPVRIFGILTDEALREATELLTVQTLRREPASRPPRPAAADSFFDMPCEELADRIADAAVAIGSLPIGSDDGLLLCDPGWLAGQGGGHRLDEAGRRE
ncbi:hypothetical protein [Streptomyces sp. NPDC046925]|uniref:hypothetical protein n=1 Tax=Streptomyces sp. NPDC046925 TaxID=3155375 RepID=UPI0033E6F11A